jgi:hypothetical protein
MDACDEPVVSGFALPSVSLRRPSVSLRRMLVTLHQSWSLREDHVWFEDRWMVASLCDE